MSTVQRSDPPAGLPVLDLPADRTLSGRDHQAATGTGHHHAPVRVGPTVRADWRRLAERTGTDVGTVALAAYTVLLARLSRQATIVVDASTGDGPAGPCRVELGAGTTFRGVLRQLTAGRHGADGTARSPARFRVGGSVPPDPAMAIGLALTDTGDALTGTVSCSSERFDVDTGGRYAAMYAHLAARLAHRPDEPVGSHSPLPPEERARLLYHLHPHRRPETRWATMAQPFEEQVERTPDAVALVADEGCLTYAELNARANRLARHLRALGARRGAFVAVSMRRRPSLLVALYAVAKSGAAYVPVDPDLPDQRIAFMLDDSAPAVVLVDEETRARVPSDTHQVVTVDTDAPPWARQPADNLPAQRGPHLIHMLYTSGTTGRPKAVAYPVDGALADIGWLHRGYPYGPGDTALFKTSYGFDVSIWEIFWPLYTGARIAVCPPDAHRDPVRLREFVDRHRVTAMFMVPSMMAPFYQCTDTGSCPSLRRVFCGGEAVSPHVRDGFHARFDADIVNCYGPTELGCVAETVLVPAPGAPVPVGPPVPHRRVYLLDEHLEPVPIGTPGELFVGGDVGVAVGYHRRRSLTAERFLADPFGTPGSRMYRTGDLCRYRADGEIEHLGRVGRQVKLRGVRIELGEIEAVFAESDQVTRCVVTVVPHRDGEIAAFVVPASPAVSVASLAEHARRLLPTHMVPTTITTVDQIPTLVNGKTDVERLLGRLDRTATTARQAIVPPETDSEAAVTRIFGRVLDAEVTDVTVSFFDLGGHSLQVFRLIELCSAEFGIDLTVRDVLSTLTVRHLAARIDGQREGARRD